MSVLLKEVEAEEVIDMRCPLLREFYSAEEALEAVKSNHDWKALYGESSLKAGILLAETREAENCLTGRGALTWLQRSHSLHRLRSSLRWACEIYFSDPGGVAGRERIYDAHGDRFLNTKDIREKLWQAMKPLRRDLLLHYRESEGFPLLTFKGPGEKVLLPLGTEILFLGPYRKADEEVLLHPDVRIEKGRVQAPFRLSGDFSLEQEKDGSLLFLPSSSASSLA